MSIELVLPRRILRSHLDGRGTRPAPEGPCCCWRIATSAARLPRTLSPADASAGVTVDNLHTRLLIYLPVCVHILGVTLSSSRSPFSTVPSLSFSLPSFLFCLHHFLFLSLSHCGTSLCLSPFPSVVLPSLSLSHFLWPFSVSFPFLLWPFLCLSLSFRDPSLYLILSPICMLPLSFSLLQFLSFFYCRNLGLGCRCRKYKGYNDNWFELNIMNG